MSCVWCLLTLAGVNKKLAGLDLALVRLEWRGTKKERESPVNRAQALSGHHVDKSRDPLESSFTSCLASSNGMNGTKPKSELVNAKPQKVFSVDHL